MKAFTIIVKILTALSAVVGGIYILATYGEQIVAWCKKAMESTPDTLCNCKCKCDAAPAEEAAPAEVAAVEEVAAEEVAAEEVAPAAEEAAPVEEVSVAVEEPAEETAPVIVVAENEPVAEACDFAE